MANNVMLFHDRADYDGLERNTVMIVMKLGYDLPTATKCARLVRDIYIQYDNAQELHEKGDENAETARYSSAHSLANQLNILLDSGYRTNNLINMVYYWRHKRKTMALLSILRDWVGKLGVRNFPVAAYCSYLQIRAGYSHDKRDRNEFEKRMSQLWSAVILTTRRDKLPILF